MAYILAVNPDILSAAGMDKNALFTPVFSVGTPKNFYG
jgi:xanthine/uracil/vitamin C permease (AzgA family)